MYLIVLWGFLTTRLRTAVVQILSICLIVLFGEWNTQPFVSLFSYQTNKQQKKPSELTCREKVSGDISSGLSGTNSAWGCLCRWTSVWSGCGFIHVPSSVTARAEKIKLFACHLHLAQLRMPEHNAHSLEGHNMTYYQLVWIKHAQHASAVESHSICVDSNNRDDEALRGKCWACNIFQLIATRIDVL